MDGTIALNALREIMAKMAADERQRVMPHVDVLIEQLGFDPAEHQYFIAPLPTWRHYIKSTNQKIQRVVESQTARRELERRYLTLVPETLESAVLTLGELSKLVKLDKGTLRARLAAKRNQLTFGLRRYAGEQDGIGRAEEIEVTKSNVAITDDPAAEQRAKIFLDKFKEPERLRTGTKASVVVRPQQQLPPGTKLPEFKMAVPKTAQSRVAHDSASPVSKPGRKR